jgi:hypothetical protein
VKRKDADAQKADLENLVAAMLPLAQESLAAQGEFVPYGATMNPQGQITKFGGFTGDARAEPAELITLLKDAFRRDARAGTIIACAVFYNIQTGSSEEEVTKMAAIGVDLDHQGGESVILVYPYKIGLDGKVRLSAPLATKGQGEMFRAE